MQIMFTLIVSSHKKKKVPICDQILKRGWGGGEVGGGYEQRIRKYYQTSSTLVYHLKRYSLKKSLCMREAQLLRIYDALSSPEYHTKPSVFNISKKWEDLL